MEFGAWSALVKICPNFDASNRARKKTRAYLFTEIGALFIYNHGHHAGIKFILSNNNRP